MTRHALSGRRSRACTIVAGVVWGLAGCATVPDSPKEVLVRVPVPCITVAPVRPSLLSDAELNALDDRNAVIALGRDRRIRQGYQLELEAVVAGCR